MFTPKYQKSFQVVTKNTLLNSWFKRSLNNFFGKSRIRLQENKSLNGSANVKGSFWPVKTIIITSKHCRNFKASTKILGFPSNTLMLRK